MLKFRMLSPEELKAEFSKMPRRRQAAIGTRIFLAVFFVVAGLIKIFYL